MRARYGPASTEQALGALPVAAGFCRRLDIAGIIDRAAPVRPVARATHGQVIEALIANRLTSPSPMIHVQAWARQRDLGDIGVAGEEDQLVAARIGEDGQRLIRTACRTRTGPVGSIRSGVCRFTPATARRGGSCCVCRGRRRGIPRWGGLGKSTLTTTNRSHTSWRGAAGPALAGRRGRPEERG